MRGVLWLLPRLDTLNDRRWPWRRGCKAIVSLLGRVWLLRHPPLLLSLLHLNKGSWKEASTVNVSERGTASYPDYICSPGEPARPSNGICPC